MIVMDAMLVLVLTSAPGPAAQRLLVFTRPRLDQEADRAAAAALPDFDRSHAPASRNKIRELQITIPVSSPQPVDEFFPGQDVDSVLGTARLCFQAMNFLTVFQGVAAAFCISC
jgi:hypothetical protein